MSTAAIKAMQDWLSMCPAIEANSDDLGGLCINFLGPEPVQFSLEDSPGDPVLLRYFNGSVRAKNYALTSRFEFCELDAVQAANSGLLDAICDWIESQNNLRSFPDLGDGRIVQRVEVTSTGYLQSIDANTCRFQLQLQVQYFRERRSKAHDRI